MLVKKTESSDLDIESIDPIDPRMTTEDDEEEVVTKPKSIFGSFFDRHGTFSFPTNESEFEKSEFYQMVRDKKVFVIGIFGKSSHFVQNSQSERSKEGILNHLTQKSIFDFTSNLGSKSTVRGFHDNDTNRIFLNLNHTGLDSGNLLKECQKAKETIENVGFQAFFNDSNFEGCQLLLFLFHVCHLIIVYHPNHTLDLSYIHMLKTLDSVRSRLQGNFSEILRTCPNLDNYNKDWIVHGRQMPPSVLFYFATAPIDLRGGRGFSEWIKRDGKISKHTPIRKLEFSLEDQIYQIFRKARVITSSPNCLFNIPPRDGFVYVENGDEEFGGSILGEPTTNKLNEFLQMIDNPGEIPDFSGPFMPTFAAQNLENSRRNVSRNFSRFVEIHIDNLISLPRESNDRIGAKDSSLPNGFERPSACLWYEVATSLFQSIVCPIEVAFASTKANKDSTDKDGEQQEEDDWAADENSTDQSKNDENKRLNFLENSKRADALLADFCQIENRFSELRCQKAVPVAVQAYKEGLQPHYVEEYHNAKLLQALSIFSVNARGPASGHYAQILADECTEFWKNGRQMCEEFSLTGNRCTNQKHLTNLEKKKDFNEEWKNEKSKRSLPTLPHNSGVTFLSSCNCGRKQSDREDPFSVEEANFKFYAQLEEECCKELDRIDFPCFKEKRGLKSCVLSSSSLTRGISTTSTEPETTTTTRNEISRAFENLELDDAKTELDKLQTLADMGNENVVNEASPEFVNHMVTNETPFGRLPTYPSWSLVQIGSAYLYSHNAGITQPGFVNGSRTLSPWDIPLKPHKEKSNDKWPNLLESKRTSEPQQSATSTSKVFIGVEYECPRGHRFLAASPDKPMRNSTASSSSVRDAAAKIVNNDMPLYMMCPCRNQSRPLIAQLMRVHIVTPKAPLTLTLNPFVQPRASDGLIFHSGSKEPFKLGANSWWVLRLPFIYCGENGAHPPPQSSSDDFGKLLKGFIEFYEENT